MSKKEHEHNSECECGQDNAQRENSAKKPSSASHLDSFDEKTRAAIQEIQILEQNFEQLMQQKHLFHMEISETELALKELSKADGDIFKLVGGQVMIKTTKEKLTEDLSHKKEILELRMKSIEKQEKDFIERMEELRKEIMKTIGAKPD